MAFTGELQAEDAFKPAAESTGSPHPVSLPSHTARQEPQHILVLEFFILKREKRKALAFWGQRQDGDSLQSRSAFSRMQAAPGELWWRRTSCSRNRSSQGNPNPPKRENT